MSNECTHDCSNCNVDCDSRENKRPAIEKEKLNELSSVKKVYAVISGKGGVGKSLTTALLSVGSQRSGKRTAILDADITGPSIPKMFGLHEKAKSDGQFIYPLFSKTGINIISINSLLENESSPVIWRGPVIAGAVKQFWSDVIWNDIDVMFIDMPPGTGDVPLTVFQSIPVDGIIIVTSPQDLVSLIVEKAFNMAKMMNIPVLGLVENMSYFTCPDCGKKHYLFGQSNIKEIASQWGINNTYSLPIDSRFSQLCDIGDIEAIDFFNPEDMQSLIK